VTFVHVVLRVVCHCGEENNYGLLSEPSGLVGQLHCGGCGSLLFAEVNLDRCKTADEPIISLRLPPGNANG